MIKKKIFRSDINAMRALAVSLVLLFHFFPATFSGGYLGVDIFFVISGYLMFSVIDSNLLRHNFKLFAFYRKRINRIMPALAVMILTMLILSYILLFASQFKEVLKESLSALLLSSNYYFFSLADYFDSGAYEKLFLHTWTLSVEFQFYITFPLLLILAHFFNSTSTRRLILIAVCLLSFAWSQYIYIRNPSFAFYDVFSRYWEFIFGALAASNSFALKEMSRKLFIFLITIIILSVLLHNFYDNFDNVLRILVVLSTTCLINFNNSKNILVNQSFIQKIGTHSYSTYLWHWPIACLLVSFGNTSFIFMISGLIGSLLIGYLSFSFIESSKKSGFSSYFVVIFLGFLYLFNSSFNSIAERRIEPQDSFLAYYNSMKIDPEGLFQKCNLINIKGPINRDSIKGCFSDNKKTVFVWGDSQAASLVPGLRDTLVPLGYNISQLTTAGCSVSLNAIKSNDPRAISCNDSNRLAIEHIKLKKPELVIISQRFGLRDDNYLDVAKYISSYADEVIMLGPFPEWTPSLPLALAKRHDLNDLKISDMGFNNKLLRINDILRNSIYLSKIKNLRYIDVIEHLCLKGEMTTCSIRENKKTDLFFYDYGHLSVTGANYVANELILTNISSPKDSE